MTFEISVFGVGKKIPICSVNNRIDLEGVFTKCPSPRRQCWARAPGKPSGAAQQQLALAGV